MNKFLHQQFYFLIIGMLFHITLVLHGNPVTPQNNTVSNNSSSQNNNLSSKSASVNDLKGLAQITKNSIEHLNNEIKKGDEQHTAAAHKIREFVTQTFATNDALNNHINSTNTRLTNIENSYATKTWTKDSIKDEIAKLEENIAKNRLNQQDQKIADLEERLAQKNDSLNIPNNVLTDEMKKYINQSANQRVDEVTYGMDNRLKSLEKDKDNSNFFTADSTWEFINHNKVSLALITPSIVWSLKQLHSLGLHTALYTWIQTHNPFNDK